MKKRILVCEDDKQMNDLVSKLLMKSIKDIEVVQAFSHEDAIDVIGKYYFTVAVLDLNLAGHANPDWSKSAGVKIAAHLRDLGYGTNVIVLTGNPEVRLAFELARDYKVQDYVEKGDGATENILSICGEYINKDRIEPPEGLHAQKILSGIESGVERDIWYSNCLNIVNIDGNTMFSVMNEIIERYYPLYTKIGSGMIANGDMKILEGEYWSLREGSAIKVIIGNKKNQDFTTEGDVVLDRVNKNARVIVIKIGSERSIYGM